MTRTKYSRTGKIGCGSCALISAGTKSISETGIQPTQKVLKMNPPHKPKRLIAMADLVLCGAMPLFTGCAQPSLSVGVRVGFPSVEIRAESDFYEPLTPYGRWEVVGSYGRCWIPGGVETGWRPYCNGYWQRTDNGWYWASDEPWAWATYHYGRWDLSAQFGWYWVPQTQWAPAWVSWHSGGGYIGWAPLYPSGVRFISPRAYVFVQERRFMEPVHPSTVVVNNTTIIKNTVINVAPATVFVEKASRRKVQAVSALELRHREEAAFVAKQRTRASTTEKNLPAASRSAPGQGEKRAVVAPAPPQVAKPVPAARQSITPAANNSKPQSETRKPVAAATESRPAVKSAAGFEAKHAAVARATTRQIVKKPSAPKATSGQPSNRKASPIPDQPTREKPATSDSGGPNATDKSHQNKGKD